MDGPHAEARAAFDAADWPATVAACEQLLRDEPGDPEALDLLAQARWFQGAIDDALGLRERAYAGFCRRGDTAMAARIALWLMVEYDGSRNAPAIANGWFLRAERLLAEEAPAEAHVELEIARARRCVTTDPKRAWRHFDAALEIARGLRSTAAEVRVLTVLGMNRVAQGDVDDGMALLDEAMAAVLGGELDDPWTIGSACCQMLAACDTAADWPRAMEWCREIVPLVEREGMVPLWAWCRTTFGGVLTAVGDWQRAERELLDSVRTYGGAGSPGSAYPLARLAELRMRQGRYEEAERLIEDVEDHPRAVATGIAILLAAGKPDAAVAACERRLERVGPRAPGGGALLPLLAQARLALGNVEGAQEAVERLADLARALARPDLVAAAELTAADVAFAKGEDSALAHLDTALELFMRLGMPLESGRARLNIARVHAAATRNEAAVEEARAALRAFERLGARADADAAAALLRDLGAVGRSGPRLHEELTAREGEVLALLAEGLSNAAIAERLVISPKTAEHHVSRVLRKLDLTSRAEAAAHAARLGISRASAARSG